MSEEVKPAATAAAAATAATAEATAPPRKPSEMAGMKKILIIGELPPLRPPQPRQFLSPQASGGAARRTRRCG